MLSSDYIGNNNKNLVGAKTTIEQVFAIAGYEFDKKNTIKKKDNQHKL